MNGRPLALVKEDQQADAILEPGLRGLKAVMQLPMYCLAITPVRQAANVLPAFCRADPGVHSHLNTGRPYNADKPNKYTSVILMKLTGRCIRSAMG